MYYDFVINKILVLKLKYFKVEGVSYIILKNQKPTQFECY